MHSHAIVVGAFGGPEQLRLQARPVPAPGPGQVLIRAGPGQVLIRVRLTGVNYADILARRGGYDAGAQPPFVPGLDALGTVEQVGEGVSDVEVGQRVAAFPVGGSYAPHVLAPAVLTYPLPDALPDEAGAGLTALVTAYNTLTLAGRLQPGETALIHAAAGGVGSLAVQLARALGAGRVIGLAGTPERRQFVLGLGADAVLDSRDAGFTGAVLELTGGAGADLILDSVGGPTLERGLTCLAPFGRLVAFGQAGGQPASVPAPGLHRLGRAVIGYSSGQYRKLRPEALRPGVQAALGLVLGGQVQVPAHARFPLVQASRAHELVERRASTGKVLLIP